MRDVLLFILAAAIVPGVGTELAEAALAEIRWRDPRRRRAVLAELDRRRAEREQ